MSEELLSAMLDGECTPGEMKRLIEALEASPALKQRWSRMCLVREAMEGTRVHRPSGDFCAGVMSAIAQEQAAAPARPSKVVALPVRQRAQVQASRWQPLAGLAAAASIAAVAAVGGYRWISQPVGASVSLASAQAAGGGGVGTLPAAYNTAAPALASQSGAPQAKLVAVSATAADEPVETRWSQLDAETARQLGEYMMEHSNMRAEQGVGGALSYPRMTLRTAEYRSGERR